jgi:hypothetical protein
MNPEQRTDHSMGWVQFVEDAGLRSFFPRQEYRSLSVIGAVYGVVRNVE